jgi:hypothetical protein
MGMLLKNVMNSRFLKKAKKWKNGDSLLFLIEPGLF